MSMDLKAEVEECSRVSKAFPTSDVCFRCAMGVGHGDSQYTYISYVFRRPPTATFASAMRWREDTVDSWCVKVLLPAATSLLLLLCDGAGAMKPCLAI